MKKEDNNIDVNILIILLIILIFIYIFIKLISLDEYENFSSSNKKYDLAIMAIFKDEEDYMEEWILHNLNQGFEHFYLYCNDPDLSKYEFFKKYKDYITIIEWINKQNILAYSIQRQAYTDCVQKYSHDCQFLLMLDIDEFIIPIKDYKNKRVSDYINSLKSEWNNIKAFKIQRYNFGSNGHIDRPKGSILDNYKFHEKICSSYKTLVNTDFLNKNKIFYGVHDYNYLIKKGKVFNDYFGYHETGFPNKCKKDSINEIPIVINHYFTKSYKEYLKRCNLWKNGGVNPIGYRKNCEESFKIKDINEIEGY